MKFRLKPLTALLLAMLMAVSCTLSAVGLAEESILVDQSGSEGESLYDALFPDAIEEMPKEVEANSLLASLADGTSQSIESADASQSVEAAGASAPNALPTKVTLGVEETFKIDASGLGKKLTYKSSKPKIATVTKKGVIRGVKAGKAKITISNKSGVAVATITVTIKNAPNKVTLNKTKATLDLGKSLQLKAKLPKNTASYKIIWKSSNKKVATVDANGLVKTVGDGTANITVITFNGKQATCKITVKKTTQVFVDRASVSVEASCSDRVTVTYLGQGDIRWDSSDSNIATCSWDEDWNGDTIGLNIVGVNAGSAVITITDVENGGTAKVNVTVTQKASVSELVYIFFETIDSANAMLADKLEYYKDNYYANGYFMVEVNDAGVISTILLAGGDGKYTLYGVNPGESLSAAVQTLYNYGWELYTEESQTGYFLHSELPNFVYCLKYSSGQVDYVAMEYMG